MRSTGFFDIFFSHPKYHVPSFSRCFVLWRKMRICHIICTCVFFPRYIRNLRDVLDDSFPNLVLPHNSGKRRFAWSSEQNTIATRDKGYFSRIHGILLPSLTFRITKLWWKMFSFDINLRWGFMELFRIVTIVASKRILHSTEFHDT